MQKTEEKTTKIAQKTVENPTKPATKNAEINPYLDYLYNSNVRCPYCRAKIRRYTTTCIRCGIHKSQIAAASNIRAKQIMREGTGEQIFMTRRRPSDVSFTAMILLLIVGIFGTHCFHVGRKIRGNIILISTMIGFGGILVYALFPHIRGQWLSLTGTHDLPLPNELLVIVALCMWVFDIFCVILGLFKYHVRLGEKDEK